MNLWQIQQTKDEVKYYNDEYIVPEKYFTNLTPYTEHKPQPITVDNPIELLEIEDE